MFKFTQTLGDPLPETLIQPQAGTVSGIDLVQMVQTALEQPLEYPPLSDAIFPGDQVAIALHPDVPSGRDIAQAVIEYLLAHGISAGDLTLVSARQMELAGPDSPAEMNYVVHDREDDQAVSYLAANQAGQPVKINRCLFDADVIIPITCRDHPATFNDIYPEFSHAETIQRYQQEKENRAEQRGEIRLANEHLGVFIALNVVGGPGDEVRSVLFGEKEQADRTAETLARDIWSVSAQEEVPLVIATIEDEVENQTWEQFCRALLAAHDVSPGDGQIVICTELDEPPDDETRRLLAMPFEAEVPGEAQPPGEAGDSMQRLVHILRERQVFLQSGLAAEEVEELGLGPINQPDEFRRLVQRVDRGILLRDAHKVEVGPP
ncbi:MAG: lactate racemase domain-containing protein [Mariniblastus sp.]|nr:lactate racemase domain-containing protein [Mariniblastus sp.]